MRTYKEAQTKAQLIQSFLFMMTLKTERDTSGQNHHSLTIYNFYKAVNYIQGYILTEIEFHTF